MTPRVTRFLARKRARLLLGIACAIELGDLAGAKRLFFQAVDKNYFRSPVTRADRHAACAGVWLIKELALHPAPVKAIFKSGKKAGYTRQDLERAAKVIHTVRSKRVGCGVWVWELTLSEHCVYFRKIGLGLTKTVKAPKALKAYKALKLRSA